MRNRRSLAIVETTSGFQVVHRDRNSVIGTVESLVVVIWRDETTLEAIDLMRSEVRRHAKLHPKGVGLLQVVESTCNSLSNEAREEIAGLLRQSVGQIRCSTVVFEGQGFRAAAVRGIATGLALVARPPFPHTVFATVPDAVDWQLAHLNPPHPSPARLLRAIHEIRDEQSTDRFRASP